MRARHSRPRTALLASLVTTATALSVGLGVAVWPGADRASAAPEAAPSKDRASAPDAFVHPGVTFSRRQLEHVRTKVEAGAQPWKDAFDQMTGSKYADPDRTPKPRANVECGSYSDPNHGCTDEREDATAAYTNALAWYVTRDASYAKKSIELMDAWSGTLKEHTNSNAPLQTGWAGSSWPKAAEIIKYTYAEDGGGEGGGGDGAGDWANEDRFKTMLRDVYLPEVIKGSNSNGTWELSMMEAAVGISVFLEDEESYDTAMEKFRTRTAAYVYLPSDGDLPKTVPSQHLDTKEKIVEYWQGQSTFVAGLTQETCRDFTHTGYGISAISHVAETSRIQGKDLYGTDVGERLRQALGFQSKYELGEAPPNSLCGGKVERGLGPVTEVGYNALHTRLGHDMTNTQKLTEKQRPAGSNNLFVAWETLTHAENPN